MKICFIGEANSPNTKRLVRQLVSKRCEVHVISSHPSNIPMTEVYHQKIYSKSLLKQTINILRVKKLINTINPHIVHIFGLFPVSSLGTMFLTKNLRNLVITVRGSDIVPGIGEDTYKEKFIKNFLLRQPKRIISVSRYLADQTRKYLSKPKKIDVIYCGVDTEMFRPIRNFQNNDLITIGFAKKLYALSGPDVLLKAFKYAKEKSNKKLFLKIAGEGSMEMQLKKDVRKMKLSDSVNFLGWIESTEKLSDFYRSLDIFLMPSRRESLGNAAIEASSSGLPVVASDFGGIPEIIKDGVTGILVMPEDIEGFGKAIFTLAENENLRKKMGIEGRKRIEKKFNSDHSVLKIIELYNQVIYKN